MGFEGTEGTEPNSEGLQAVEGVEDWIGLDWIRLGGSALLHTRRVLASYRFDCTTLWEGLRWGTGTGCGASNRRYKGLPHPDRNTLKHGEGPLGSSKRTPHLQDRLYPMASLAVADFLICCLPLRPSGCGRPPHLHYTPIPPMWGTMHIIQRVQCTVGVRVTVQALHEQFPSLLHRRSLPSTPPFLPGLGVGGPLVGFCLSCSVSASAVLTASRPLWGPCCWVVGDCADLGNSDAWPLAPFGAITTTIQPWPKVSPPLLIVLG